MNTYQYIEFSIHSNYAIIILNRPHRGNSITPEMGDEIINVIRLCEDNINIRSIIITGKGKYFCTGMDLGVSNQDKLEESIKSGEAGANSLKLFTSIKYSKKPTIALINGPVYGGGCGLVFVCDIRISVPNAFLCFSEVKRGIVPALISAFIVPQLGEYLSNVYMITGMKLPIKRLYELGLISEIVELSELTNTAMKYINELSSSAPLAVYNTKQNVQYCSGNTNEKNIKNVQKVFMTTIHSNEALYGISCFAQKQKPDWTSLYSKL